MLLICNNLILLCAGHALSDASTWWEYGRATVNWYHLPVELVSSQAMPRRWTLKWNIIIYGGGNEKQSSKARTSRCIKNSQQNTPLKWITASNADEKPLNFSFCWLVDSGRCDVRYGWKLDNHHCDTRRSEWIPRIVSIFNQLEFWTGPSGQKSFRRIELTRSF